MTSLLAQTDNLYANFSIDLSNLLVVLLAQLQLLQIINTLHPNWHLHRFSVASLHRWASTNSALKTEEKLTQCVDGWQCDVCGLNETNRVVFLKNAVPPAPICIGNAQGICSCARNRSKIGINSAKCSSTT